jgi:hypothetical protein
MVTIDVNIRLHPTMAYGTVGQLRSNVDGSMMAVLDKNVVRGCRRPAEARYSLGMYHTTLRMISA